MLLSIATTSTLALNQEVGRSIMRSFGYIKK